MSFVDGHAAGEPLLTKFRRQARQISALSSGGTLDFPHSGVEPFERMAEGSLGIQAGARHCPGEGEQGVAGAHVGWLRL